MAYAGDLKSSAFGIVGSSPTAPTMQEIVRTRPGPLFRAPRTDSNPGGRGAEGTRERYPAQRARRREASKRGAGGASRTRSPTNARCPGSPCCVEPRSKPSRRIELGHRSRPDHHTSLSYRTGLNSGVHPIAVARPPSTSPTVAVAPANRLFSLTVRLSYPPARIAARITSAPASITGARLG